jgi:DNA primase
MGAEVLISRLQKVKELRPGRYMACCPAHQDGSPSLSVSDCPDGRVLVHCFAGCPASDVMEAVGLSMSDLFPEGAIRDYLPSAISRQERRNRATEEAIIKIVQADLKAGKRVSAADAERAKLAAKRLERLGRVD